MLAFLVRQQQQQGTVDGGGIPHAVEFDDERPILCWADTDRGPCNSPGEGSLGLCEEHREEKIG